MPLDRDALEQLQLLRTELIEPTVKHLNDAVDAVIKPVIDKQIAQEAKLIELNKEVQYLRGIWLRVCTGAIVWSTILGLLIGYIKSKIMQWVGKL